MLTILFQRDDLHRDVSRLGVLLQLAEHGPPEHVGEEHVEGHGHRSELARQGQRFAAPHGHEHFEALVVRQIHEDPRVVRIVLDDEQRRIFRLQIVSVVDDRLSRTLRHSHRRKPHGGGLECGPARSVADAASDRRPGVSERQVERERTAHARRAAQLDLAAEQVRQLATDCQAETGSAKLPARAGVGLLERLEDDSLFLGRDADAGIGHLK